MRVPIFKLKEFLGNKAYRYCHELELRALTVDVMKENPAEERAERSDAAVLLELQQVSQCALYHSVSADIFAGACSSLCSFLLAHTATNVSPTPPREFSNVTRLLQVRVCVRHRARAPRD